jgi:hypothetical protein
MSEAISSMAAAAAEFGSRRRREPKRQATQQLQLPLLPLN